MMLTTIPSDTASLLSTFLPLLILAVPFTIYLYWLIKFLKDVPKALKRIIVALNQIKSKQK